jgi:hypothetical protein
MNDITLLRESGPDAPALTTAVRHTARAALLEEIYRSATARGRLPSRKMGRRIGAGLTVAAVAWGAAVVITRPDPMTAPSGGMRLVAVEEITFPLSLDPVPPGMTPRFSGEAGSAEAIAGYISADGENRFDIVLTPEEPTWLDYDSESLDVAEIGTVTVGGAVADFVRGSIVNLCDESGCRDRPFADLVWERAPGEWVLLQGQSAYGAVAAAVAVAESLVERPQPINLQVGLAPAGWSVVDWHESSGAMSLANDADANEFLHVQCMPPFPSGSGVDNGSAAQRIESVTAIDPAVSTDINGLPAEIVHARDYMDEATRFWLVAWELPDGTVCSVTAPEEFTQDDVLTIAEKVTYTS